MIKISVNKYICRDLSYEVYLFDFELGLNTSDC